MNVKKKTGPIAKRTWCWRSKRKKKGGELCGTNRSPLAGREGHSDPHLDKA